MSYWKIIPEELIDWIEKTKAPERYHRLVNILLRLSNWADGTYNDGVEVKKGQVRLTLRKLSQKTGYSLTAIHKLLKRLSIAGWISISNQNSLTVITLNWLYEGEHPEAVKVNTNPQKGEHQGKQENQTNTIATKTEGEHQGEQKIQERCTPEKPEGEIRNNTKNIEIIRSKKQYEDKHTENNRTAPPQNSGSDSEEGKKIDREIVERLTEEIIREFKVRYKQRYKRYPVIDRGSRQRVIDTLLLSAENEEELADIVKNAISKIPAFFFLTDKWVMKQGYSFFAFSYRLGDLLSKPVNKPNVNEGWSREQKVGEAALW